MSIGSVCVQVGGCAHARACVFSLAIMCNLLVSLRSEDVGTGEVMFLSAGTACWHTVQGASSWASLARSLISCLSLEALFACCDLAASSSGGTNARFNCD